PIVVSSASSGTTGDGHSAHTAHENDSGFPSEVSTPDELHTSTTQTLPVTTTASKTMVDGFSLDAPAPLYSMASTSGAGSMTVQAQMIESSHPIFSGLGRWGPLFEIQEDEG